VTKTSRRRIILHQPPTCRYLNLMRLVLYAQARSGEYFFGGIGFQKT